MNNYNQNEQGVPSSAPPINITQSIAQESGLIDKINQENFNNQQERQHDNYQEQLLGYDPNQPQEEPMEDDYASFIEEEPEEVKPKKRMNDSKKRISQVTAEKKAEREQKEQALLRAEIAERENKRLADENAFLILTQEKAQIEQAERDAEYRWALAKEEGDAAAELRAQRELREIDNLRAEKEYEIRDIADKYTKYREEEDSEATEEQELQRLKYAALEEFSDPRELDSPLYDGFLDYHDYLSPNSSNYDARIVERVEPVKWDLIQELKMNGQSDAIGTKDYFEELSLRINQKLNPRIQQQYQQQRGPNMNVPIDPRYQQPNYQQLHQQQFQQPQQYQQQYQPQYQQPQQQYQQQQFQQPQQQYQQQQYQQPQQQSYVAPVNRAGYSNNFSTNPHDINLDNAQREAVEFMLPSISRLSKEVYGRGVDQSEAEANYKQSISQNRR